MKIEAIGDRDKHKYRKAKVLERLHRVHYVVVTFNTRTNVMGKLLPGVIRMFSLQVLFVFYTKNNVLKSLNIS